MCTIHSTESLAIHSSCNLNSVWADSLISFVDSTISSSEYFLISVVQKGCTPPTQNKTHSIHFTIHSIQLMVYQNDSSLENSILAMMLKFLYCTCAYFRLYRHCSLPSISCLHCIPLPNQAHQHKSFLGHAHFRCIEGITTTMSFCLYSNQSRCQINAIVSSKCFYAKYQFEIAKEFTIVISKVMTP